VQKHRTKTTGEEKNKDEDKQVFDIGISAAREQETEGNKCFQSSGTDQLRLCCELQRA
jgi:hypothetical protein